MSATHECPGCGKTGIPRHMFACRPCWYRLPRDIRLGISGNYRRDMAAHMEAMMDAAEWYAANPQEQKA